jgi:hypothetical protein
MLAALFSTAAIHRSFIALLVRGAAALLVVFALAAIAARCRFVFVTLHA